MIEALGSKPCADRMKWEASTFPTAWCKFHQDQSAYQRFVEEVVGLAKPAKQPSVEPVFST